MPPAGERPAPTPACRTVGTLPPIRHVNKRLVSSQLAGVRRAPVAPVSAVAGQGTGPRPPWPGGQVTPGRRPKLLFFQGLGTAGGRGQAPGHLAATQGPAGQPLRSLPCGPALSPGVEIIDRSAVAYSRADPAAPVLEPCVGLSNHGGPPAEELGAHATRTRNGRQGGPEARPCCAAGSVSGDIGACFRLAGGAALSGSLQARTRDWRGRVTRTRPMKGPDILPASRPSRSPRQREKMRERTARRHAGGRSCRPPPRTLRAP
jgi:hypothetical protein